MNKKIYTPSITIKEDNIEIIGDSESLKYFAEMIQEKAKLGKNASMSFYDGINKPINIILDSELLDEEEGE